MKLGVYLSLVGVISIPTLFAQNENIALGAAIVDRSPDFNADFTAEKAFDGAVRDVHSAQGPAAYWLSPNGQGDTAYFVADLGSSQPIAEIALRPSSNSQFDDRGTLDFQIRGGDDLGAISGVTPTAPVILSGTLPDVTGAATALQVHPVEHFDGDSGLTTGSYRYLRFESLSAVANNAALGEIIARSNSDNVAFHKPIIDGSGAWSGGTPGVGVGFNEGAFAAAHAVDGVVTEPETQVGGAEGDYWLSREATDNEFFVIDLGSPTQIARIDLMNTHNRQFNDRGTADFNVQTSADGVAFTPLVAGTLTDATGAGGLLPVDGFSVAAGDFAATTARYVRFEAETVIPALSSSGLNEIRIYQDAAGDTDGDNLLDAWEIENFGDLTRDGSEDEDLPAPDGLANRQEHDLGLDPLDPDSDDDTLTDGDEVNVHGTNPMLADTDSDDLDDQDEINTHGTDPNSPDTDLDTLSDSDEIQVYSTNPLQTDSDSDGWADATEVAATTDPNDAEEGPNNITTVGIFTGGDPGDGLDLSGDFVHAINVGSNGAPGLIGDADFVQYDSDLDVTITWQFDAPAWNNAAYGDSAADDALELLTRSILWSAGEDMVEPDTLNLDLAGLQPGARYKLQLIFDEACCPQRGFDVSIEEALVADEFSPGQTQGEPRQRTGAVLTHEFIAGDDTLNVVLDGTAITTPELTDHNSILQGATVELIGAGDDFVITSIERGVGTVSFSFNSIGGANYWVDASFDGVQWDEIDDGVIGAGSSTTFVDIDPLRVDAETVIYRVRDFSID